MSIWQKAYETYDNHAHLAGVYIEGKEPLSPICHMVVNAQIEISLKADGTFYEATTVSDNDRRTVIPVTEESADRGSIAAHPLSDELQYLAGTDEKRHKLYVDLLTAWAESEYSTPKVRVVQKYILGGTILQDLLRSNLIVLNEDMTFAKKTDCSKYMVRWRVYNCGETDECWRDNGLFESWQNYYIDTLSKQRERHICMVSGKEEIISSRHPRATISLYSTAKLISSKDSERKFAYAGRFLNPNRNAVQAATIGFASSQKMHCALRWLFANEKVVIGKAKKESGDTPSFVVCWSPCGKKVYNPVGYDELFPNEDENNSPIEPSDYKQLLYDTIRGYKNLLPDDGDVCIASLDVTKAKMPGRLSITYYSEQKSSDYYSRVQQWFDTVCFPKWDGHSSVYTIKSPTLWNIVMCAFGTEDKKDKTIKGNNDHFIADQMKRLIPCVTESAPISLDIVRSLQAKASQPQNYKYNYDFVLHTACAVIRKYHNDLLNKEEWTMQLDTAKNDRSYLFGRLLAVMEYIERSTYEGESREPNAINLYSTFCVRPLSTAKILEERIIPYMQKHTPGSRAYLRTLMADIYATFREEDEVLMNHPLGDTYLLGYYLQRKELYTSKQDKEIKNTKPEVNQNGNS